jgi:pimeloyl-ACP methyl ester carboxylesterase
MATTDARTDTVTSADGTTIAYQRSGSGTPLLLLHGALSDHTTWDLLAPHLQDEHELLALDRRGHPPSGDSTDYKPALEADDLFAVVASLHAEVDVLAHSSGAVIVLRAAERGLPLRRLVLYEPPVMQLRIESRLPRDIVARIDALLAADDRAAAVDTFLRYGPQLSDQELDGLHASRRWPALLAMAHTSAYDMRVVAEYTLDRQRLAAVRCPVLFLSGSTSPPWYRRGIDALDHLLPNSRILTLPDQGHNAMLAAPDLLAAAVHAFLAEAAPDGVFQLQGMEKC